MYATTIKNRSKESGFSLIEIAIGMILVGFVLIPAIVFYQDFSQNKDWEETKSSISTGVNELSGYNTNYSRYPCPASLTAARGTAEYGFELADCATTAPAVGSCDGGICTYASAIAGESIVVGMLPFKTLNVREEQAYDAYHGKLRYAVTMRLTDADTYTQDGGVISIVDRNDFSISMIDPPDSAHFIVISHGKNQYGAFASGGGQTPCSGGGLAEEENCDQDATFISGEIAVNYDDTTKFFNGVLPTEWKKEQATDRDIFLKDSDSIAIGAAQSSDLSNAERFSVFPAGAQDGAVLSETRFFVNQICEEGATTNADCFQPQLIAGLLEPDTSHPENLMEVTTAGQGMSCYDRATGQDGFLVGIADGGARCSEEIFLSCPDDTFVAGITADGHVKCSLILESCDPRNITTTCGDDWTLPTTGHGEYARAYSGECHMFSNVDQYDEAHFINEIAEIDAEVAALGIADPITENTLFHARLRQYIDQLNDMPRDVGSCGTTADAALVRDTYQCTNGAWSEDPISTHETNYSFTGFHGNVNLTTPFWTAETNGNPPETDGIRNDINKTEGDHDCWCREDFRVGVYPCPDSDGTFNTYEIELYRCGQTLVGDDASWDDIHISQIQCPCGAGTEAPQPSGCVDYYNEINSASIPDDSLEGDVIEYFEVSCSPGPGNTASLLRTDTDLCTCSDRETRYVRTDCPTGTTNSWTSPDGLEEGVQSMEVTEWVCPNTTTGGLPDPGEWVTRPYEGSIPPCECENIPPQTVNVACPDGLLGTGRVYTAQWDCTTNSLEPEGQWDLVANNCTGCQWSKEGEGEEGDAPLGQSVGGDCTCGTPDPEFCHDYRSDGEYDIWGAGSCTCSPINSSVID